MTCVEWYFKSSEKDLKVNHTISGCAENNKAKVK